MNYHIKWSSEVASGTQDLSPTTDHFGLAIVCDKTYEFQVMAVNICGRGTFSAPVQQMCGKCLISHCTQYRDYYGCFPSLPYITVSVCIDDDFTISQATEHDFYDAIPMPYLMYF